MFVLSGFMTLHSAPALRLFHLQPLNAAEWMFAMGQPLAPRYSDLTLGST